MIDTHTCVQQKLEGDKKQDVKEAAEGKGGQAGAEEAEEEDEEGKPKTIWTARCITPHLTNYTYTHNHRRGAGGTAGALLRHPIPGEGRAGRPLLPRTFFGLGVVACITTPPPFGPTN